MRPSRPGVIVILMVACVCVCVSDVWAQEPDAIGVEFSAHGAVVMPVAEWSERSGVNIGAWAMARYALPIEGLSARARLGFLFGIPTRSVLTFPDGSEIVLDNSTVALPLLLGADYRTPLDDLSVHAELGFASLTYSGRGRSTGDAFQIGGSTTAFVVDVGASYDLSVVRVGLDVLLMNVGGDPLYPGVMFTVGVPLLSS